MALVDKPDLRMGFWVGLGVVGAFVVWGLISMLLERLRGRLGDG